MVTMDASMGHYTIRQMLAVAPISARTVRNWVQRGIIPPPTLRGPETVYPRQTMLAVSALCHLRSKGVSFADAAAAVTGASTARLEEILGLAAAHAESTAPAAEQARASSDVSEVSAAVVASAAVDAGESWRRVRLLPGLELHLRGDAREVVRRIADEIVARYAAEA